MTLSAQSATSLANIFPAHPGDGKIVHGVLNQLTADSNGLITAAGGLAATGSQSVTPAATGTGLDVVGAALTTGKAIDISDLGALTTGTGIHIDATGVTQTSGKLIHVDSASTALTSAGRLILSDHTGAAGVSAVLNEFASAAADETTIVKVTASAALAAGVAVDVSAAAMTTGKGIDMSDLAAITTGKAIHIDATGITQTDGVLVHVDSASTALTATGRLLLSDHTGNAGVSAVLNEFASAAADETTICRVTASAALALGTVLDLSGAAVTTGTILDLGGLDALTTGTGINVVSNASGTGTRTLVNINNDNTAAVGTTCLAINNDATAGAHIVLTGTGILGINFTALGATDKLFDCTAASGCTAAPQTNAAVGFIGIKVGGTDQWVPYYNAT